MSQKRFRAVALLDRDGTVIEEREYLADPAGVELLPGAAHAIRILNQEGIAAVLTTNQSGIPRGFLTEETLVKIHERMVADLAAQGAHLDAIYHAPSLPDSGDPRRKPATGMYHEAVRDLDLAGLKVFSIGDRTLDVEFGVNAGGKGIRVLTGHQLKQDVPNKLQTMLKTRAKGLAFTSENILEAVHLLLADLADDGCYQDRYVVKKFADMYGVANALETYRARQSRIVLANGCFDLLHGGHASYLEAARQMGDVPVVAPNSEASVRRLKGESRPIINECDRIQILANFRCVDYVTMFHDDTADHLIEVLRPDIHAKGTDYTPQNVPEGATNRRLGHQFAVAGDPKENSSRDIIKEVTQRAKAGLL